LCAQKYLVELMYIAIKSMFRHVKLPSYLSLICDLHITQLHPYNQSEEILGSEKTASR
jgi:hypothetical protein